MVDERQSPWIGQVLAGLQTSQLTWVLLALFLVNLVVPDPLPFIDEALLGLATLLVARWRGQRAEPSGPDATERPMKNVTPPKR